MVPAKTARALARAFMPTPTTRVRLDYLHGLRGLAALAVVLGHCAQLSQLDDAVPPWPLQLLRYASSLAVPTFIVLSGYCLALPVLRTGRLEGGPWGFMVRRARRILPAYYGALGLSLFVGLTLTRAITPAEVISGGPNVLGPLLLLHDVVGATPAYNRPLWSLAVEWHIYFAFPFLVAAWGRVGLPLAAGACALLALLAVGPAQRLGLWGANPQMYALFACGVVAAWLAQRPEVRASLARRPARAPIVVAGAAAGFAALLVRLGWSGYAQAQAQVPTQVLWGLVIGCVLVALAASAEAPGALGWLRACLSSAPLRRLGAVSYSLYVLHWVPVSVGAHLLGASTAAGALPAVVRCALLVGTALPLSVVLAVCSYRFLERPYLRRRDGVPAMARLTSEPAGSAA